MIERKLERAGNFLPRADLAGGGRDVDPRVVALSAPASEAAERYRALHHRLERARGGRALGTVALVAATHAEGTTLTTANLAVTAARANRDRRVALVELNVRSPGLSALLGIPAVPGVAEVLAGHCHADEAARKFHGSPLAVLVAGRAEPESAGELLAGAAAPALLEQLGDAFDEIFVDLPPLLSCADGARLAARCSGILWVLRAGKVRAPDVARAHVLLEGMPLWGCVLNDVDGGAA